MRFSFFCFVFLAALNAFIISCAATPNQENADQTNESGLRKYILLLNAISFGPGTNIFDMENPAFLLSFPNWEVPDENSDVMTMIKKFFTTESMKNVKEQHNHIEIALKRSDIQNLTQILSSSKSCKNWLNKFTSEQNGALDNPSTSDTFLTVFILKKIMNDSQRQNSSIEVHTVYFTKPNENEILQDHFQSLLLGFSKETLQNKKPKAAWPLANYKNRDTSIWFTKSKYANCGENLVEKFKYNLFRKPIESSYVLGFFEKDKETDVVIGYLKYYNFNKQNVYSDAQTLIGNFKIKSTFTDNKSINCEEVEINITDFDRFKNFNKSIVKRDTYIGNTTPFDTKVNKILETHSDLRVNAVNPIKFKTIVVVSERETKDGNKDERLDLYVTTVLLFKREEDQDREETLALAHAGSLLEVFGKENKHKYEIPNSILYYCDHNSDWTMAFTYMMFKNYEDYKITKELIFPTKPFEKVN